MPKTPERVAAVSALESQGYTVHRVNYSAPGAYNETSVTVSRPGGHVGEEVSMILESPQQSEVGMITSGYMSPGEERMRKAEFLSSSKRYKDVSPEQVDISYHGITVSYPVLEQQSVAEEQKPRYSGPTYAQIGQQIIRPSSLVSTISYGQRLSMGQVGRETAIIKPPTFEPLSIQAGMIRASEYKPSWSIQTLRFAEEHPATFTGSVAAVGYIGLKLAKGLTTPFRLSTYIGLYEAIKQPKTAIKLMTLEAKREPLGFIAELGGGLLAGKFIPSVAKNVRMQAELTTGRAVMAESTPFEFVEGTTIPASIGTLKRLEGKSVIGVHVTTSLDIAKAGKIDLTAPPKYTLGKMRQEYNLGSFYVSAPGKQPRVYLGYAGILPEGYQGLMKTEWSLFPKKIKAITLVQQVSPTPKQLASISAVSTYQGFRAGEMFLAPENIARRSTESQIVIPAKYSSVLGYPKEMEQFSGSFLKYLGKKQIVYYKQETSGFFQKYHRIEFQAAELGAIRYLPAPGQKAAVSVASFEPPVPVVSKAVSSVVASYALPASSLFRVSLPSAPSTSSKPSVPKVSLPSAPSMPSTPKAFRVSLPSAPSTSSKASSRVTSDISSSASRSLSRISSRSSSSFSDISGLSSSGISKPSVPRVPGFSPPSVPPIFQLPKGDFNLSELRIGKVGIRNIRDYMPSFTALAFNIRGRYRKTKAAFTGLEFRPITRAWRMVRRRKR